MPRVSAFAAIAVFAAYIRRVLGRSDILRPG